jgi:hypothetical protein
MRIIWIVSLVISLLCLWGVVLINDHQFNSRLDTIEASLHSAQHPKKRDTFVIRNDGAWVLTSADTVVITSNGLTKRIISLYYSK